MTGKRQIIITGASGFIGRSLVQRLSTDPGSEVIPVDLDTNFNLALPGWTDRLPETADSIVHLAQSLQYRNFPGGAKDMFAVNTASTQELADWAIQHGIKKFIFTSTGNVYRPSRRLLREEDECQPTGMYAATKYSAELLLRAYAGLLEVVILRPFGVYGPGQQGMLIAEMIRRVNTGEVIQLAQNIGISLTPIYIDDAVAAITRLVEEDSIPSPSILNLAGSEILTLRAIVDRIAAISGKQPNIQVLDHEPGWLTGDNTRLKAFLAQFTPFDDGLQKLMTSLHG
jgi:nucleoside-diphosphate-sugar epimerase